MNPEVDEIKLQAGRAVQRTMESEKKARVLPRVPRLGRGKVLLNLETLPKGEFPDADSESTMVLKLTKLLTKEQQAKCEVGVN